MDRLADAQQSYRRAVDLKPADPDLRNREGTALILLGRFRDARERLEAGLEAIPGHPALSHTLARLLATAPDAAVRDGGEALRLAQVAYGHQRSLEHAETLAMALAEQGNFQQAAQIQTGLLMQAQQLRNPAILQRLQGNLQRYQRGEAVRIEAP
jgi:Tfp pilus assembly protein PilF